MYKLIKNRKFKWQLKINKFIFKNKWHVIYGQILCSFTFNIYLAIKNNRVICSNKYPSIYVIIISMFLYYNIV